MSEDHLTKLLGPALARAFAQKGYEALTPVQEAVLDPDLAGRDLRITSQTGSGKTAAIGFILRELVSGNATAAAGGVARPFGLVVAPTRELARQVEEELTWLYAHLGAKVASATGGADYRTERRALSAGPAVVVGTPGRLADHLQRGGIDPSQVGAVVLDEADRMLDMGFREELEAILARVPEGHRTHLVSATFPRDVLALANKVQDHPAHVQGTPLGAANADIDHVVHLVDPSRRLDAVVNILLSTPEAQTLIFVRTRADVNDFSRDLAAAGFRIASLSGEMEQRERNRALAGFKGGELDALVATDVAARGIDVQDIARVIHFDPPSDPDTYTHRSGRTGRAGKKGTSCLLIGPGGLGKIASLMKRAGVRYRVEPIPTADQIRANEDERAIAELTAEDPPDFKGVDERVWALAKRLVAEADPTRTVARLLLRTRHASGAEPRDIRPIAPPPPPRGPAVRADSRFDRAADTRHAAPRFAPRADGPRTDVPPPPMRAPRGAPPEGGFVLFRVSWGSEHGADARRLLPMLCRRGGIEGRDIGTIQVARRHSVVEIARPVAASFAEAAALPDERNPRVHISPERAPSADHVQRAPHRSDVREDAPREDRPRRPPPPHASKAPAWNVRRREPGPPKERPSRARVTEDRPSRARVPADRPSRAKAPAPPRDRPSRSKADAVPRDRPSRAKHGPPGGYSPPKRK